MPVLPRRRRFARRAAIVLALLAVGVLSGCAVDQQIVGSWRLEHNQDDFSLDSQLDPDSSAAGLVFNDNGKASLLLSQDAVGDAVLNYKTRDGHIEVTHDGDPVLLASGAPLAGTYWFNNEALFIHLDDDDVDLIFFRLP
jgi:hypothetical protein